MDKVLGGLSGSGSKKEEQQTQTSQAGGQKEDYADKGLDAVEKKQNINLDRNTNERITDTAREGVESFSGKDVPENVSN